MGIEDNKDLAARMVAAIDRHDLDGALALVHPDLLNHSAIPEAQGAAGLRIILSKIYEAFPDMRWRCEDVIAEGDRVMCRITMTGTHTGPLRFVRLPLEATGRRVRSESVHLFRMESGKIVEHWAFRDDIGTMRQLGRLEAMVAS